MIDETTGTGEQGAVPERQNEAERVGFCQQCGKPLTSTTVRRVGAAVYCEPCLVARLEGAGAPAGAGPAGAGWAPVGGAVPPVGGAVGGPGVPVGAGPGPVNNEPSPWLAAFLGLIPGVGAMYNGQYAKGLAHLVIYVVLQSLANNVNGIFGILVAGWIFYQAFDAYHTAKARRDGTVLPNAFGLNDIGDRMGFGRNWPGSVARPVTGSTTAGWGAAAPVAGAAGPVPPAGAAAGPNWAGYVPPTNFAGATAPPPPPPVQPTAYAADPATTGATSAGAAAGARWTETAYGANPYAGPYGPYTGGYGAEYGGAPLAAAPVRRFPVGAAWLIALGLIFLLVNLNASWRLSGEWIVTIVLAALGSWLLFRRVESVRAWTKASGEDGADSGIVPRLMCQVRAPIMLLVLALLFALQAAGIRTIGQTWGVLLIAFGALLILERMAGRSAWVPMGPGVHPGVANGTAAASGSATSSGSAGDSRKDAR